MIKPMWRPPAFQSVLAALVLFAGCGEETNPLLEESSLPGLRGELLGLHPCNGQPTGPVTSVVRLLSPSDSSVVMEAIVSGSFELDVPAGIYQMEVAAFGAEPDRTFGALEFHDTLGYKFNGAYRISHVPHTLEVHFEETVSESRAIEILSKEGASPIDVFLFSSFLAAVSADTHADYTSQALVGNYPNEVRSATPESILCPE